VAPEVAEGGPSGPVGDVELMEFGEQLTGALESGDVEAWLALHDLDDVATAQQRDWFAAVRAVPMDLREMHPTSVLDSDPPGEGSGAVVEFGFRHQVTGADLVPSLEYYRLTLQRSDRSGELKVVEVAGDTSLRAAYPQLWDLSPVTVVEGETVVVLADEDSATLAENLLPSLDEAGRQVLRDFPIEGVQRMVVTLAEPDLVARLYGDSEVGEYAGFAIPAGASPEVVADDGLTELETTDDITVRLVLDEDYTREEWEYYGDELTGGAPLLRHEGLHLVMMLHEPDSWPPAWAVEGLAGWYEIEADDFTREDQLWWYDLVVAEQGLPEAIPPSSNRGFFPADGDLMERHYADSAMLFWYVEEAYGRDSVVDVGVALHEIKFFHDEDQAVEDALQEHLGVGADQLEADWLDWVRSDLASEEGSG
jgi:hypothetical protein